MPVTAIANFVKICIERSSRNLMEERLLDMGVVPLDENDVELLATEP